MSDDQPTTVRRQLMGQPLVTAVKDQVTCDLSGEAVVLQMKDSMYYGLDPVGAAIWKLIQTPKSIAEICEALVNEYEVTPGECEADVRSFLAELQSQGLITLVWGA